MQMQRIFVSFYRGTEQINVVFENWMYYGARNSLSIHRITKYWDGNVSIEYTEVCKTRRCKNSVVDNRHGQLTACPSKRTSCGEG